MGLVEVVLASNDRVTVRVGDTYLKIDADQTRTDVEVEASVDVDRDLVRAWWSWRCLVVVRWLFENGYGSPERYPEVAVLRSQS